MELNPIEARVLGSLMEKARTTPDIYPLTLRALVGACNQKTSRDPITDHDEDEVLDALDSLREKGLAMRVDMAGSRTAKFRENASSGWELEKEEYALLCTLLLRGPQTPGQLRQRCERLYPFAELSQVTDWLGRMQAREEEPVRLVQSLGRAPGTKEIRYAHTLLPVPESLDENGTEPVAHGPGPSSAGTLRERVDSLEDEVAGLRATVTRLENILHELIS